MHHASRLEKCATLPRVFDFDLSNPWEGLRIMPKMYHFTTRSVAFSRSTRPIHCKNRGAERFGKMCNFTSRSVPRPRQSIVKIDASRLTLGKCVILPRVLHLTSPIPGKGCSVPPNGRENVSFYLAFLHLTSPIPGKGLRVTPTMCHFTTRFDARPGQSMVRVAFPMEASELAPALERIFKL